MSSIIFDCDGVILNSNKIKSDAFYDIVEPYDKEVANKFRDYHIENGGISRYQKFEYLMSNLLFGDEIPSIKTFLEMYSKFTIEKLKNCEAFKKLEELKLKYSEHEWFLISGSDQQDLRKIFKYRDLSKYFEGGIYGSPRSKSEIIHKLIKDRDLSYPCIYYGDSKYDYYTAIEFEMNFVFVGEWSEVQSWRAFCKKFKIDCIENLNDLL